MESDVAVSEPRATNLKDYRAPDYRVTDTDLTFDLDPKATRVTARMNVVARVPGAPLILNGENVKLISAKIDGKALMSGTDFNVSHNHMTLETDLERFLLEIETEISPATNTELSGLYTSSGIFCTQCEAEGFRRITYYIDRPDNLAVFTTRIEAAKSEYPVLLSNGNLIESGDLEGGKHFAVWNDPFPKPCYLFALVAGDLGVLRDEFVTISGRKVALAVYVEHGNEEKSTYAMDSLKRAMRWDEEVYGREYDLDIFMIVAVSAFNFGAMENKGLNIFNERLVLASPDTATDDDYARIESVVAHEYFHNWTGNRITCRDWFQLSLKEGLTVFRDQGFSADMRSAAVRRIEDVKMLRMRQFAEDGGPLAHPVQPQSYITIDNFYTATIYEKGSEVIGMLKSLVGDEGYRKATDLYFERHDGEAATVEDWVRCFEDACGRDLSQFRLWYSQSGTPRVNAHGSYDEKRKTYTLTLKQELLPTPGQLSKKPMHLPVRVGLIGMTNCALPLTLEGENAVGPKERVLELTAPEQQFVFVDVAENPLPSIGRGFSVPANYDIDLDRSSRATLMSKDTDAFNRWEASQALASEILHDMIRDAQNGKTPKTDPIYIDAIGAALADAEHDPAFAAQMLVPPLECELAMQVIPADPDAIHTARMALVASLFAAHADHMRSLYSAFEHGGAFSPDAKSAGRRALRNTLLRYLSCGEDNNAAMLAHRHYETSTNMTDAVAALGVLSRMTSPLRTKTFYQFHDRFHHDVLVLDKWLSLQAGSPLPDTADHVRTLMSRPNFDMKNPNRVRALVGAFAANHFRFHASDGTGYQLVGETVRALDSINPQVAARMAGAFENWRRYDESRQKRMRAELQAALDMPGLSSNMFEVASKMLG